MKRWLAGFLVAVLAVSLAFGQGWPRPGPGSAPKGTPSCYFSFDGNGWLTAPDAADIEAVTGGGGRDIAVGALIRATDYTTLTTRYIAGKWTATTNGAYRFGLLSDDGWYAQVTFDGQATGIRPYDPTGTPTLTDGNKYWVGWSHDGDNGSTQSQSDWYIGGSSDTPSWGAADNTKTVAGTFNIYNAGTGLFIVASGDSGSASSPFIGKIYQVFVVQGTNIGGTQTLTLNANDWDGSSSPFTSGGRSWTVNGTGTTKGCD